MKHQTGVPRETHRSAQRRVLADCLRGGTSASSRRRRGGRGRVGRPGAARPATVRLRLLGCRDRRQGADPRGRLAAHGARAPRDQRRVVRPRVPPSVARSCPASAHDGWHSAWRSPSTSRFIPCATSSTATTRPEVSPGSRRSSRIRARSRRRPGGTRSSASCSAPSRVLAANETDEPARDPRPRTAQSMTKLCCSLSAVHSRAMAAKDVVGNDLPERARRKQAPADELRGDRPARGSTTQCRGHPRPRGLLLGPPERSLAPLGKVDGPQNLKRRAGHTFARGPVQRNVVARSELGAVPLVPVRSWITPTTRPDESIRAPSSG